MLRMEPAFESIENILRPFKLRAEAWVRRSDPEWDQKLLEMLTEPLRLIYRRELSPEVLEHSVAIAMVLETAENKEQAEKVVACAILYLDPYDRQLLEIRCEGVLPDYTGKRIGTALFKTVERTARFVFNTAEESALQCVGVDEFYLRACVDKGKPTTKAIRRFLNRQGFKCSHTNIREIVHEKTCLLTHDDAGGFRDIDKRGLITHSQSEFVSGADEADRAFAKIAIEALD
jgi:GNAT superfamily N-acetyltransferase